MDSRLLHVPETVGASQAPRQGAGAGRFAPSPTGPLHLGSLVAAVGSYIFARAAGLAWLVRIEDLDTARVVPGAADGILRTLERYGLEWDGTPVWQSQRVVHYEDALSRLRRRGYAYDCACSRAEVNRSASAPAMEDRPAGIYPGTCRGGLPPGRRARAVRFRVAEGEVAFQDAVLGTVSQNPARSSGDFVIRRADGPFAYQLAVVVDDDAQMVTQVVRGADLVDSAPRQILLQRALGLPQPAYAHLPVVLGPNGSKLGKRDGALPLETLDERRIGSSLARALVILGQVVDESSPGEMLEEALRRFDASRVPSSPVRVEEGPV